MTNSNSNREATEAPESRPAEAPAKRKPYEKPAFQREQVFETMALACGKLSPTQQQCRFNRKSS